MDGYIRDETTGEFVFRTDIKMGTPDVYITLEPGTREDHVPIEGMYAGQYALENQRAGERLDLSRAR